MPMMKTRDEEAHHWIRKVDELKGEIFQIFPISKDFG